MPLDASSFTPVIDELSLFRRRREDAAELWRSIPRHRLCMNSWMCGSTACALGWLAEKNFHQEWRWSSAGNFSIVMLPVHTYPVTVSNGQVDSFSCAAFFFGMTYSSVLRCFKGASEYMVRIDDPLPTPEDVARRVLNESYVKWVSDPTFTPGGPGLWLNEQKHVPLPLVSAL